MRKPLCVLLHGYPNNNTVWKEQLPVLQDNFEIMNLSLPGSEDGIVYNKELELGNIIKTIIEKIDQSGSNQVILIGHDIGSFILAEVSAKLGDKIKAQVFLAGMDFKLFKKRLTSSSQIMKSWYILFLQFPKLSKEVVNLFKNHLSKAAYKKSIDLSAEAPHGFTPVAIYSQLLTGFKNTSNSKSTVPTLFLFGKDDRFITAPRHSEVGQFYEDFDLKIVSGGHWFLRENILTVNETMMDFFSVRRLQGKHHD